MKQTKLKVNTGDQKYPIIIGSNLISKVGQIIKNNSIEFKQCLLVVDRNISNKLLKIIKKSLRNKKICLYFLNANEKNKSQKTTNNIIEILLKENFSRKDCLIAIGGGITGDVAGFAASLCKRGIQFINIPSTLLSQVDSSIGGKTGVNSKYGKNLIGSFYQPKLVISDSIFLRSLPRREIICGYGEILKHSIISNKNFYEFLNLNATKILDLKSPFIEKAIFESCKIKKSIVEKDEKEKNLRKVLNFGHTFAHGFEAALGYSKKLNHGEAVILGISTAIKFSKDVKLLKKNDYETILDNIKNTGLPYNIKKFFSTKYLNQILSFMIKDKKNNSDKINLILLKKIGSPVIDKVYSKNFLKTFLKKELTNR